MKKNTMRNAGKKDLAGSGGFTLVEVCMVTIISGLIFVAMYDLYAHYSQQQDKALTLANIQAVEGAVSGFYDKVNRYPCPADRTLPYDDPNFGKEVDPNADILHPGCDVTIAAIGLTPGFCYSKLAGLTPAGTNGVGGVCMVDCATFPTPGPTACGDKDGKDTYKYPDPILGPNTNYKNVVLIGGIPMNSIRAVVGAGSTNNTGIIYDAWGSQMDYVVSYTLTRVSTPLPNSGAEGTYKFDRGAITVHDENGNDTAASVNNAHFGVISHGRDRIGGYTKYGQMTTICGSHVPQSYFTGDDQNCSNNPVFIQGIRNDSKTALHYDDLTFFDIVTSGGLWSQYNGTDMENINVGTVNVGTDGLTTPPPATAALNVGAATAGNGVLHADNSLNPGAGIKAAQVCDTDDATGCFPVKNIVAPAAAPVITCPAGKVMRGISNSLADCVATNFGALQPNKTCCVAGVCLNHWMIGITTDGNIICR